MSELDASFFRIVANLMPASWAEGASALLSQNDADTVDRINAVH